MAVGGADEKGAWHMRPALWLLVGLIIGGIAGWYVRGLSEPPQIRPLANFGFNDNLASQLLPVLVAQGTWRGNNDLAQKINTVRIVCNASEATCVMHQADVTFSYGTPHLSLDRSSFSITKIDAQTVIAEPALPDSCVRRTLTFDRRAQAVTFVRTKISGEGVCSIVQDEPLTLFLGEPLPLRGG
jgi:hypothetical protein